MNYSADNNTSISNDLSYIRSAAARRPLAEARTNPFNAADLKAATVENPKISDAIRAAATSLPSGFLSKSLAQNPETSLDMVGKLPTGYTNVETQSGASFAGAKKAAVSTEERTTEGEKAENVVKKDTEKTVLSSAVQTEAISSQPLITKSFQKEEPRNAFNNINFGEGNV